MKGIVKLLLLTYIVSLLMLQTNTSTCHILCSCINSQCNSCYNTFQKNTIMSTSTGGTCPCPQGFYSMNNTCLFCSKNCKVCSDGTTCIQCYTGYTKINGICSNQQYNSGVTWVQYQSYQDFKYKPNSNPSLFGFNLFPDNINSTLNFVNCSKIWNNLIVGILGIGNQGVSLVRNYYGLPYHQWVHLTIKYAVLDSWNGSMVNVDIYMDQKIANKTYNNSLRNTDICGGNLPDSIDQIHSFFSHQKNSISINISTPANSSLAIVQIKVDVGTCPRNCLNCSGPNSCLICKNYYVNVGGICQCNTSLSHAVSFGCLEKCLNGYVFIEALQRCVLCSIYMSNCQTCNNSTACLSCRPNTFLSNGSCVLQCPQGYYPKKIADNDSNTAHCHPCSQNCTSCFNQSLCLTCQPSFYLSAGYCFSNCPNGTLTTFGNNCYNPNNCKIGCKTCTSFSICQQCQVGFWLFSSSCVVSCPVTTFHSQNKTCQPCSSNCIQCIDSQTCQSCFSPFPLINGTCKYYSTSCNPGFYFDQRVSTCISCPSGCQTCQRSLCYTCLNNFYLDNGQCLPLCSSQKYQVMNNITTDNICYWKNQLCESVNSNSINSCSKCRSFDYILALDQTSSTCQTYCPLNLTYSNRSPILNENQRICNQSCGINCQTCLSSSKCFKCASGFVISGTNAGNCVSVCQNGYVSDSLQCLPCPFRCNTCDINGNCLNWAQVPSNNSCPSNCNNCINNKCTKCNTGFFLNLTGGQCLAFCQNGNFPDTVSMQCRKCSPLCSSCSSYSTCTSCFSQYYLYSQNCLNNCPSGTYPNKQQQLCQPCSINCRTCFGPSQHQCLTCYLGNYKDHSQCVPTCPVHKYVDNYGYCDWCHQSCLYCFGPAEFQCLQCDNSNFLYRGQCYTNSCPSATFLAILPTKQCKDCSWGCAICTSATVCQQCFGGFYLFNNSCLSSCPTGTYYSWSSYSCTACSSNCISCASQTLCYQCQPNYSIYNGECMLGCPNTTFPINYYSGLQCHPCPTECINCTGIFQCTICSTGFILKNGQCTKNCEIGKYYDIANSSCKSCSNNCLACTAWGCMVCQAGYYQYNNGCVQNCSSGTYIIPETMSCSPCLFSCLTCISLYQCQNCKHGYNLVNNVCVNGQNCSQNCQRCADLNNCLICSLGYYKVSNSSGVFCISTCPVGSYLFGGIDCLPCQSQCLSCNSSTGCTNCKTGLILFNGQCITDCYPGFYSLTVNGTKICQPCDSKCQTCSLSPTNCIICASSTQVFKNGECAQNRQCLLSSFYSEAVGYCLPCISNCKICHITTQCDQCLPNYYLTLQNQCQSSCPNGTYQSISFNNPSIIQCLPCQFPCQTCISSTQCQNCYPGYPLNTTSLSCQSNCNSQVGYFINSLSNTCDKCDPQCLSCISTSNTCTSCPVGYYLIDNNCVLNCPQGTFPAATVRSCLPCSQFCQSCISQTSCQICQQYMVMFLEQCVPECPSGYYNQNGICKPCVNPCLQCIGGSTYQCSNCKVGYYFFNGRCTQFCPEGFYKNNQTLSCQACPNSCKNCLDFSYCQICITGYTFNTTTRQCQNTPICPLALSNCQNCINNSATNTTQCNKCFLGYYLISGICVEQCNSSYYGNILTGKCESCDSNCLNCEGSISCNKCLTNFYLFNGICYNQCPIGTYPFNETINSMIIQTCRVDPCIHYIPSLTNSSLLQCMICVSPYLLSNGQCINNCPVGTYQSQLQCKPCQRNCLQCADYSRCTKCLYPPYHFYNLQCLDNCPSGTYSYQKPINTTSIFIDGQCLPCFQNCLVCTNGSYCQICAAGYFLSNDGKCVLICSRGFYADVDSSTCRNCSTNCQSCLNILQCQTCASGSFLISGQCVTDCPQRTFPSGGKCLPCNQFCRLCGVNSNCSQCISGYFLNLLTNQCVQQCPSGTYITNLRQCAACATSCLSCVNPNECVSCLAPKILYNAQCINQCPSGYTLINNICTQCDSYCKQCSITRDNCTSCQIGFQLINGYCRPTCPSHTFRNSSNQCQSCVTSNAKCSQCYGPAVDQCIQCYSPYYLLNNVCVMNCPEGYFSSITTSSQCLPCDNRCLTCNRNSLNCTTCQWGYYLVNGSCLNKCPNGYYPTSQSNNYQCKPCINPCIQCSNSNTCINCLPGYFVTPFGTCVTNCSMLVNSSLPTSSFYFSNTNLSRCEQCSTGCRNCISSSQCVNCILPYHLYNNECIIDCPLSNYLNTTSNTCQQCTKIYCTSCISLTQCTECQPGYYLLNSSCTQTCPSGYTILNGKCVINNNNNTVCTGYRLNTTNSSTECVPYCPLGYYPSNYQCLPCSLACTACTNSTSCQQCISPYILLNGQCISNCPTGYLQQGSICIPCSSNCFSCSPTSTDCTTCLSSYYLFNGQCVVVCPATTYPDPITKKCLVCPTKCITCSSAIQCLQCQNTRYNPPNCTDTICSQNMYKIQSTGQCGSCDISCLTCKGGSIYDCLSCQSPLRFINGQCRTNCPNGFVLNTLNNTCISCNTGCKNCTFNASTVTTSCIQCFIPLILYNNACIQSCQVIETSIQSYTVNNLRCYPCPQNCISCTLSNFTTNGTTCLFCQAGYILFMGSCINQCPTHYYPLQNSCYRCPQNCQSCSSTANSCINCTNNTYLISSNCVPQCPNATYTNTATKSCIPCTTFQCNRCTTAANKCDQCNPPFAVDQYNGCNNCISGYLWDSVTRGCLPCDSSCSTCNFTVNNCTTCAGGRILVQGQCVQQCPVAFYQITLNNIIQCKPCPTNCTICQPSSTNSSSLECYQCKTGYYHNIATHQCLPQCPTNTFITNSTDCNKCPTSCSTCSSNTQCNTCITGYHLFNGQCVNVCPNQYIPVKGTCQNCGIGCINCTSLNNCTKCRSDYYLNINKTCSQILPCPAGQYSDVDGSCKPCETNCLACTNSTNCTQCISTLFLNNGNCSNTCSANQYSTTIIIYTQTTNITSKICRDCLLPCDSCISNTSCTHCIANYYLTVNKTCVADCGSGFYNSSIVVTVNGTTITNRSCIPCRDINCKKCTVNGCQQCRIGFYLLGYNLANQTNGTCVNTCPSGYYNDSTAIPPVCRQCNISGCDICNSTQCTKCLSPLILLILNGTSSCVSQCPTNMMQVTTNNITKCQNCTNANCLQCRTQQWCTKCIYPFYLQIVANQTQNSIINYKTNCQQNCSIGYYPVNNNITANNTCQPCQTNCMYCINLQNCTQCIQTYVLVGQDCIPQKCLHCTTCVNQKCQACEIGYYLYQVEGKCYQICPDGYFGNNQTSKCQICMDNCIKCPSLDKCDQCKDGYNFTGTICVDQAFIQYGALSNMSGFTSNITYITSAIYLGTSIGPMVFGQMTTTYFNIQFCQFILFHARASGNNSQMQHFLNSLQSISLTLSSNNNQNGNSTNGRRRMLATSLSDPQQFLVTSAPIFAMMGAFLLVYLIIFLFEKYMQEDSCLFCPKFKFYASQICVFMKKRFKWIYFDFIAWMSFVPFVYFSLMQLKDFSFETALSGFSCILSIVIIVAYPLYPFFIIYLLKQNYNDLVQQTNLLVQMSLSPFVYKVKRPEHQLVPGQPIKDYFTASNFRLIYDPLKYLRKFIFVVIVALCPVPTTSLIMLIILNIMFIGYMAVFRPRVMPYMIFDFIIQGILLFFEVFMLIYLYSQTAKVTAMSIATHAVGFITANLSLIIAIILNIIAYYKIFMCLYELYKHLQEKAIQKEKADLKDQEQLSHHTYQQNDLPQKDLTKSLKGIKKLRDSKGEDATQFDQSDNPSKLMRDKQLYGDNDGNKDLKRSTGVLPDLKKSTSGKDKNKKTKLEFEQLEDTLKPFEDKQLPKKLRRSMDDDQLTQSNPDSKIQSGIFKDKEIYRIQRQEYLRNSQGSQIPDLKTSQKKQIQGKFLSPNINSAHKLNKISESDEDSMIHSHLSGEQLLTVKQGKIKEGTGNKYKRNNLNDPNQVIVSEGIPIKGTQNKYKRKTKQLPEIESRGLQQQNYDLREGKYKQRSNGDTKKQKQIQNGKVYNKNPKNSKQLSNSQNGNIEQGQYKQRRNNQKGNNILDIPILQKQGYTGKNKQTNNTDIPEGSLYGKQKPNKKYLLQDQQIDQTGFKNNIKNQKRNDKYGKKQKEQLQQGRFNQRVAKDKQKQNKIGANQDFDQFLQESQKKVPGVDLKQIERRKKYQQEQIADVQFRNRNNKGINKPKDTNLLNQKGQIVIEGGNLVQHKKDKFRRDNKKIFENDDNNDDLQYKQNKGKKLSKNQDIFKEDLSSQIQSGQLKPQIKVKAPKQNNKNNYQAQDNIQIENQKKKNRKRDIQSDQGELEDEYQRRKQQQEIKRNKKGVLGVNQDYLQEEYDQIKKRNKDNMFSPDKGVTNMMMGSLDVNDFDGSDYQSRPQSRIQRPGSKGKGMLGIDDKQGQDSEDDSSSVRRQRVSAIQKLRKKQGNLGIDQRSDYSGDSATSRPQKQQTSKIQRKRKKSGILKLSHRNQTSQPVQSIQLQRNN